MCVGGGVRGSRWHAWKGKICSFIAQTKSFIENIEGLNFISFVPRAF